MNADDRLQDALEAAADALFERLDPEDLDDLVAKMGSDATLRAAAVARAAGVLTALAATDRPATADEYTRVIAATLTGHGKSRGVLRRTDRAAESFAWYRRFPTVSPELLTLIGHHYPDDQEQLIPLLDRSLRIRTALIATGATEPPFLLDVVVPAVVMVLSTGPDIPDEAAVEATRAVLGRGTELPTAYRASGRPVPGRDIDLPILGNADFLVRMAAYRVALDDLRNGAGPLDDLDDLDAVAKELVEVLRAAMTRSVGSWRKKTNAEPDMIAAFDQFAGHLGAVAGKRSRGARLVRLAFTILSRRIRLPRSPNEVPINVPDWVRTPGDPVGNVAEVNHLVGWLVAGLFEGVGADDNGPLVEWLIGDRPANLAEHLPLLLRRLRVATHRLDAVPDGAPPRPAGVSLRQYRQMVTRLSRAVDPHELEGVRKADGRRVVHLVLPPLWTHRRLAGRLVASHLRPLIGVGHAGPRKALLVATAGSRAPVQFVVRNTDVASGPCCAETEPPGRTPRTPVEDGVVCPHRPWGEIGLVENYRTLGEDAEFSPEAARRQLERYQGPWRELLLGVQVDLSPDDC
ncbi:MAG: hypothetical protein ACR2GH_07345 [Pseudonocardia sp.]